MLTKQEAEHFKNVLRSWLLLRDPSMEDIKVLAHYDELNKVVDRETEKEPLKNFLAQAEAAARMQVKLNLNCPVCHGEKLQLLQTLGSIRVYRCAKCEIEMTVE